MLGIWAVLFWGFWIFKIGFIFWEFFVFIVWGLEGIFFKFRFVMDIFFE